MNVWVPDDLLDELRRRCPDAVVSRLVQDAIRGALGCAHDGAWACSDCGTPVDRLAVEHAAMERLWRTVSDRLERLPRDATIVGAHKLIRDVTAGYGVAAAQRALEWRRPRSA